MKNLFKGYYKFLFLSVIILCSCGTKEVSNTFDTSFENVEHIEHSIKSSSGETVADIYFEKPYIIDNSKEYLKINEYFNDEYTNWLYGKPDKLSFYNSGNMNLFLDNLENMRNEMTDDVIAKQPLEYSVSTDIIYYENNILSVKQVVRWFSGGPADLYFWGTTFDLNTEELLPFNYFYDIEIDDFKLLLKEFLISNNLQCDESQLLDENLLYNYYYDGNAIYLTLNQTDIHSGSIIQWNGKEGEFVLLQ